MGRAVDMRMIPLTKRMDRGTSGVAGVETERAAGVCAVRLLYLYFVLVAVAVTFVSSVLVIVAAYLECNT